MFNFSTLKTKISSSATAKLGFAILALVVVAGSLIPNIYSRSQAVNCNNAPSVATLNFYPVTWNPNGEACKDFPALTGRNLNGGSYPTSQAQFNSGVTAHEGDMVQFRAYIHNGARIDGDVNLTTARNIQVTTSFTNNTATNTSTVRVSFGGDNTNTVSSSMKVNLGTGETLQLVPNSGEKFKYDGSLVASGFQLGDNTYNLGDLQACFEHSKFLRWKFVVVKTTPPQAGQIHIIKEVRNLTTNSTFSDRATAKTGETVEYRITNTATVANVANVVVTDTGTSGVAQTSGSLRLNGATVSGVLSNGINLPQITTTVPQVFTYRGTVTSTLCNAELVNTARATLGQTSVQDTATVIVQCVSQPALRCTPATQTVQLNQVANLNATGGTGTYSWQAPAGTPSNGTGSAFATRYATSGTKTVTVTSGTQSANCAVIVQPPVVQIPVVCNPNSQTVDINQSASLTATGGNGTFTWSAIGGTPSTGTGSAFATHYSTSGTKTVTVSSNGQSDTCTVVVRPAIIIEPNVYCSPTNQTVLINNLASFTATGGNGTYSWHATGGSPSTSTGSSFGTRYSTIGDKTVTVTSGSKTASCYVHVNNVTIATQPRIAIDKLVKNISSNTSFQNSVSANTGDRVQFQIVVTSNGTETVSNVHLIDSWNTGLNFDSNSVKIDGNSVTATGNGFNLSLGNMIVGQSKRVTFEAVVTANTTTTIQNIAKATGNNVNDVTDDAFVTVTIIPGNPNLVLSKKVRNDRTFVEGVNVPADREDFITYTLTVTNNGNSASNNFVITDDLSGVLPFADMVDLNGAIMNGNFITYPAQTIAAGGTVTKTFRMRVKFGLAKEKAFVLQNTYGNLVTVTVPGTTVLVPPKTGSAGTSAAVFAGLFTTGFVVFKKRRQLMSLILA